MKESLLLQSLIDNENDNSQLNLSEGRISFVEEKMDEFIKSIEEISGEDYSWMRTDEDFINGLRIGLRQGLEDYYNQFGATALLAEPITDKLDTLFDGSTINDLDEQVANVAAVVEEGNEEQDKKRSKIAMAIMMFIKGVIFKLAAVITAIVVLAKLFTPIVDILKKILAKIPGGKEGDVTTGVLSDDNVRAMDGVMQGLHEQAFGEDGPLNFAVPKHLRGYQVGRGADEANAAEIIQRQADQEQELVDSENRIRQYEGDIEKFSAAGVDTSKLQEQLEIARSDHQTLLGKKQAREDRAAGIVVSPYEGQSDDQKIIQYQSLTRNIQMAQERGDEQLATQLDNARSILAHEMSDEALAKAHGATLLSPIKVGPDDVGNSLAPLYNQDFTGSGVTGATVDRSVDVETVASRDGIAEKLENKLTESPANVNIKPTNITVPTTTNVVTNNNTHVIGPTPTPYDSFFNPYKQNQLSPDW